VAETTRSSAASDVAEIADRTALEFFGGGQIECRCWKLYHRVRRRALPIPLFRYFCCRRYRLAAMHSVTDGRRDRQTDRRHYDANGRSYRCSTVYYRLKIPLQPT